MCVLRRIFGAPPPPPRSVHVLLCLRTRNWVSGPTAESDTRRRDPLCSWQELGNYSKAASPVGPNLIRRGGGVERRGFLCTARKTTWNWLWKHNSLSLLLLSKPAHTSVSADLLKNACFFLQSSPHRSESQESSNSMDWSSFLFKPRLEPYLIVQLWNETLTGAVRRTAKTTFKTKKQKQLEKEDQWKFDKAWENPALGHL